MVSIQAGIICLTETNVEWRKYGFRQGLKDGFDNIYAASRHIFSSSCEIAASPDHKHGGTIISATDQSGEDSPGAGRWS
jgi:hypothetical protein